MKLRLERIILNIMKNRYDSLNQEQKNMNMVIRKQERLIKDME